MGPDKTDGSSVGTATTAFASTRSAYITAAYITAAAGLCESSFGAALRARPLAAAAGWLAAQSASRAVIEPGVT